MNHDDTREPTPRLRFPEFRDEPGWTSVRLGDAATLITDRAGRKECTPFTVISGVGLVSQQERFGQVIAGNQLKNYFLLQKNDFAYNKSATKAFPEGYIARYFGDKHAAVPNSIFTCFRLDEQSIDPAYLDYLFAGNLHGRWLKRYITVGARAHGSLNVNDADLMALPVPVPSGQTSLLEQRKIAECLISLDDLIAAHTRKVDVLYVHRKGLVRQLFPRSGESLPPLRFPEFENHPEWTRESIDRFAWITTGGKDTQDKVDSGAYPFFVRSQVVQRIDSFAHDGEAVLTSGDGVGVGNNFHYINGKFDFHQRVYSIYNFREDVNGRFFYLYFSEHFGKRVRQLSAKNSVDSVRRSMIADMTVALPGLEEQNRIADCFCSLDEQISAQTQKLDALKNHKKGLMQQLFPMPNAEPDR